MEEKKSKEPLLGEDGKEMKLTLQMFCAGVLFWGGITGLAACAGARLYQEYKKHHEAPKTVVKAYSETTNSVPAGLFIRTR